MSSAALPLQAGLYSLLTGDATLMAMIGGVFDAVPDNQPCPYVTIGEVESADWSTFGKSGESFVLTLHVWSESKGKKEAQTIQNRLDTLVHRGTISVSGFTFVSAIREMATVMQDPDGVTWHGVQRFRIHVSA